MATERDGLRKSMCLGLSAATGGLLAVLSDIAQKQDASAVEHLQSALTGVLGLRTYPAVVVLALIALAVALSFIFSAESNKKAFYVGASILAIMMTAVPYNAPPSLSTTPTAKSVAEPVSSRWWDRLMIPGQVYAQSTSANNKSYSVEIHLQTDNGKAVSSATFTVIDANSGEVLGRSTVQSSDFTFYAPNRPCTLRVQVDGYAIVDRPLSSAARAMTIQLTASRVPSALQRVFRR
ncbi:MAG TPA: hypothetical protein VJP02_04395 [Candidatus Sulfotelmatobacter sp.]|nr:hypothetical protein [Candidatus Sulfotelmatobacter sp.]